MHPMTDQFNTYFDRMESLVSREAPYQETLVPMVEFYNLLVYTPGVDPDGRFQHWIAPLMESLDFYHEDYLVKVKKDHYLKTFAMLRNCCRDDYVFRGARVE